MIRVVDDRVGRDFAQRRYVHGGCELATSLRLHEIRAPHGTYLYVVVSQQWLNGLSARTHTYTGRRGAKGIPVAFRVPRAHHRGGGSVRAHGSHFTEIPQ